MLKVIFWLVALLLITFVIVFAATNPNPVLLNLWPFIELDVPLYAIALIGALVGFVIGAVAGWAQGFKVRNRNRQLMRELERARREMIGLNEQVAKHEAAVAQATIPSPPAVAA